MRVKQTLVTTEQIHKRVKELAEQLNRDYADITEPLVLVGILKGSFMFMADLCKYLTIPHVVDFMAVSSYGHSSNATKASGNVRIIMDCRENQQDRDVLIVEDILDSGHTLDYIIKNFKARYTKSVKTIVLVRKKTELTYPVSVD